MTSKTTNKVSREARERAARSALSCAAFARPALLECGRRVMWDYFTIHALAHADILLIMGDNRTLGMWRAEAAIRVGRC
jgi:hypothetical protein